jgi:hypothetical protein
MTVLTLPIPLVIVGGFFAFFGLVMFVHLLFEAYHMGVYLKEQRKRKTEPPWVRWYVEDDGRLVYRTEDEFRIVGHLHLDDAKWIVETCNRNRFVPIEFRE